MRNACVLLVVLLSLLSFAAAVDEVKVVSPPALKAMFGADGLVVDRPAMFGIPHYGSKLVGTVIYATWNDTDGCSPLVKSPRWLQAQGHAIIAMVDRGDCSFVTKVRNAETAGAQAVIVIDNQEEVNMPFMQDDGNGASISLPSVLIRHADGQKIISQMMTETAVIVMSMEWRIPQSDNKVTWEFWTTMDDEASRQFKQNFQVAVEALGNNAILEAHYHIVNGDSYGCEMAGRTCGNQCDNGGRYCALDPDGDLEKYHSGADVVDENLRQMCVLSVGQASNNAMAWWEYVNYFNHNCFKVDGAPSYKEWTPQCRSEAMAFAAIDENKVKACMDASWDPIKKSYNSLFEKEILKIQTDGVRALPTFIVNAVPYRGGIQCDPPVDISHCGVLAEICAGFKKENVPAACNSEPGCPLGQRRDECGVCGGVGKIDACDQCLAITSPQFNKTCAGCDGVPNSGVLPVCGRCGGRPEDCVPVTNDIVSKGGLKAGYVVLIVIAVLTAVGLGIFFYTRRQQDQILDDVDSLLQQYLPLDHANQIAGEKNGPKDAAKPAHQPVIIPL